MIYNEKDKTHWVSFQDKLIHYDKEFREIKTYGEEDGYNGGIYKMVIDDEGNLWFVNNRQQVGRLNKATGIITLLSKQMDIIKRTMIGQYLWQKMPAVIYIWEQALLRAARVLIGLTRKNLAEANISYVYIRSLAINLKQIPLSTGTNSLQELSLRYNQNTISIETGIIDFYTNGKNSIRYKLVRDGKDEAWQYGQAYNTIRYDGLVPGKYELVMQASNAGNEFRGPEKILMITINSPFWQKLWFQDFGWDLHNRFYLRGGSISFRSLRIRNAELEGKVMARTKELKHSWKV